MKKPLGKGDKVSAKVTGLQQKSGVPDPFNTNLGEEAQGLAEAKKKFKMAEADGMAKFIQATFKLEGTPMSKRDFTDPRWPRNEIGEAMQVEKCFFFAMKGPREAFLGFRSLGDDEINGDGKVIIDTLKLKDPNGKKARVENKIILAKKWAAEQTGYRYFYIHEDEVFEDEEAEKVFLERFASLTKQPDYVFGKVQDLRLVDSPKSHIKFY